MSDRVGELFELEAILLGMPEDSAPERILDELTKDLLRVESSSGL
jgi:hypothetical protein